MKKHRVIIDRQRCKGCELCVAVCPRQILSMAPQFNRQGTHYPLVRANGECIGCCLCAIICPEAAIEIEQTLLPDQAAVAADATAQAPSTP